MNVVPLEGAPQPNAGVIGAIFGRFYGDAMPSIQLVGGSLWRVSSTRDYALADAMFRSCNRWRHDSKYQITLVAPARPVRTVVPPRRLPREAERAVQETLDYAAHLIEEEHVQRSLKDLQARFEADPRMDMAKTLEFMACVRRWTAQHQYEVWDEALAAAVVAIRAL